MMDYIAALLSYLFRQDKEAHPAPAKGKANLQEHLQPRKKEEP